MLPSKHLQLGIGLLDMVLGIAVVAIIASAVGPLLSYSGILMGATRDTGDSLLSIHLFEDRFARDVRRGVPRSVRLSPRGDAIEFIHMRDAGLHRSTGTNALIANVALDKVAMFPDFVSWPDPQLGPEARLITAASSTQELYASWNLVSPFNTQGPVTPLQTPLVVTERGAPEEAAAVFGADESVVQLATRHTFPANAEPVRTLYIASEVVQYRCQKNQMFRLHGYVPTVGDAATDLAAIPEVLSRLSVLQHVSACRFGVVERERGAFIAVMELSLDLPHTNTSHTYMRQVHMINEI